MREHTHGDQQVCSHFQDASAKRQDSEPQNPTWAIVMEAERSLTSSLRMWGWGNGNLPDLLLTVWGPKLNETDPCKTNPFALLDNPPSSGRSCTLSTSVHSQNTASGPYRNCFEPSGEKEVGPGVITLCLSFSCSVHEVPMEWWGEGRGPGLPLPRLGTA